MKRQLVWVAAGLVFIARSVWAAPTGVEADRTVVYKTVKNEKSGDKEDLKLHLFLPPGFKDVDRRSAIVLFSGGAWKAGSPRQFYPHCKYFASRGMVAISAEYRVAWRYGTSPKECVADGKSAIRWIREHARELGVAPDKIVAGGGSAGGHVAAATGTVPGLNEATDNIDIDCRPTALVLFNPVYDNGPGGYGYELVKGYWKEISPMHNIDKTTPPTIVFLGTKDKFIPEATARKYKQLMEESGCRCDLHLYAGQKHGFFNSPNKQYYEKTLSEADRFLESLGLLDGKPMVGDEVTLEEAR